MGMRVTDYRRKFGFKWNEPIGLEECPYMHRWVLKVGTFSIRLHRWFNSDDTRYYHDHPWWFLTIVLKGGYTDRTAEGDDKLGRWSIRFRPAHHAHTVCEVLPQTWTLVLTGKDKHDWGFHTPIGWIKHRLYFLKYGHHPCE